MRNRKLIDNISLNESLNTPVPFKWTTDTKIPDYLYAQFDIDGTKYGVIISKTNMYGLYMVNIGYIPNTSMKLLKIMPGHMIKVLSTTFQIIQSAFPHIRNFAEGFAIKLPGNLQKIFYSYF